MSAATLPPGGATRGTNLCKTERREQLCSKSLNAKLYGIGRSHSWWHQLAGAYNFMQTDEIDAASQAKLMLSKGPLTPRGTSAPPLRPQKTLDRDHAGLAPNVRVQCAGQVQLDRAAPPHEHRALLGRQRVGIDSRPSACVHAPHPACRPTGRPNATQPATTSSYRPPATSQQACDSLELSLKHQFLLPHWCQVWEGRGSGLAWKACPPVASFLLV